MTIRSLACLCLAGPALFAQSFDVAWVKPAARHDLGSGVYTYPGGRVVATQCTLKVLMYYAWDQIDIYRILGGPSWADSDPWELEAKPPDSSPSSKWIPASFKTLPNPEMRLMLRNLLTDRFQLKTHFETRKETVYDLVPARGGAKLRTPKSPSDQPFVSYTPTGLRGQNATLDQLVERLATVVKRPVHNRTGIEGHFDFVIDFPRDDAGTDAAVLLLGAIQDQIGLKLESKPGTVDVLVIDSAQKPAGN